jgi:hypothetical protein
MRVQVCDNQSERFRAMLEQRRAWAVEQGLSADVIEKRYAEWVQYGIDEETQTWKAGASSAPPQERYNTPVLENNLMVEGRQGRSLNSSRSASTKTTSTGAQAG